MIKGIFWDNDGVLVDTEVLYFRANKSVFSKLGVKIDEKSYAENFLKRSKGIWHLAKELGYSSNEIIELRNERNQIYSNLLTKELKIIDGAESVLKKFDRKFKMSIVTSSRRDHFEIIHKQTGFRKYFDFEITSDECKETKPSPKPYLMALELSRLKKKNALLLRIVSED